jgi:hypothetical protein
LADGCKRGTRSEEESPLGALVATAQAVGHLAVVLARPK